MSTVIPIFFTILTVVIFLCFFIGVSLGIGKVLTLFLPFSLFEGTLLSMIATISTFLFWYKAIVKPETFESEEGDIEYEIDDIPQSRFWREKRNRTWGKWYRYVFANSIYDLYLSLWPWGEEMSEEQAKSIAVQMAEAGVEALKSKSSYTKQVRVSSGKLKHELSKLEYTIDDDYALNIAAKAINEELIDSSSTVRYVIRKQLWNEAADISD